MASTTQTKGSGSKGSETKAARPGAAGSGDSGPGTSRAADPDESKTTGTRTAARTVTPEADGPIEAPDATTQTEPGDGYPDSSTNNVAAAAGLRTAPGENHSTLVDEDGNEVSADDLFDDAGADKTYVTAKKRVLQQFTYRGTDATTSRLFLRAGRRVPRGEAERIKASIQQNAQG